MKRSTKQKSERDKRIHPKSERIGGDYFLAQKNWRKSKRKNSAEKVR